jgi:hypothetical protein
MQQQLGSCCGLCCVRLCLLQARPPLCATANAKMPSPSRQTLCVTTFAPCHPRRCVKCLGTATDAQAPTCTSAAAAPKPSTPLPVPAPVPVPVASPPVQRFVSPAPGISPGQGQLLNAPPGTDNSPAPPSSTNNTVIIAAVVASVIAALAAIAVVVAVILKRRKQDAKPAGAYPSARDVQSLPPSSMGSPYPSGSQYTGTNSHLQPGSGSAAGDEYGAAAGMYPQAMPQGMPPQGMPGAQPGPQPFYRV